MGLPRRAVVAIALAIGPYLLGTLLVDDLVDQLAEHGEIDVDRYLALVTGDLGGG